MSELSLPERIVHAADTAIDEARVCGLSEGDRPVYVEGYLTDFAKACAAAVLGALVNDLSERGEKVAYFDVWDVQRLIDLVRDVPAVKAV